MGCKQSRPEYSATLGEDVKQPEGYTEGVECSEFNEDPLFSPVLVMPEPTPRDLRQIRDELFSKDSLLAVASSATAETLGTMDSSEERALLGSQTRFITIDSQVPTSLSSHASTQQYHYPAALYDDMKSQKHYVPTFNMASTTHHFPITDRVPSNPTSQSSSASDESSSAGGGFDELIDRHMRGDFPVDRFADADHLIDTMSMFLEPLGADSERSNCMRKKPPKSLGALVDALTFREDEDDFSSCDGGETAAADAEMDHLSCTVPSDTFVGGPTKQISSMTSSNNDILGSRIYEHNHSSYNTDRGRSGPTNDALPSIKSAMSAEILSNMKTQAMMANQSQDRASVLLSFSSKGSTKNSKNSDRTPQDSITTGAVTRTNRNCLDGYCENSDAHEKVIQYHRSDSVMPKSSDGMSVCSELAKWM